jgi:hypothetical protein
MTSASSSSVFDSEEQSCELPGLEPEVRPVGVATPTISSESSTLECNRADERAKDESGGGRIIQSERSRHH